MSSRYLELSLVSMTFQTRRGPFQALSDINLRIDKGEVVSLIGHSGCGKSTLLNIVAAEMLIGGVGIGFFIWDAWNSSRISDIVLALFYVGMVGFALDRLVSWTGRMVAKGTSVS